MGPEDHRCRDHRLFSQPWDLRISDNSKHYRRLTNMGEPWYLNPAQSGAEVGYEIK